MTRISDKDKNTKIGQTYAETMKRRKEQRVRVYTVKVQYNKLNAVQRERLKMMFVEAKWMYNHILNLSQQEHDSVFSLQYTDIAEIRHLDRDGKEILSMPTYLSSQMRQGVLDGIISNIRALAKAKSKGEKVGHLKFISEYNSINLKQYGSTYRIVGKSKIKIQGMKKPIRVNGMDQIMSLGEYELANAKLIRRPSGYYIAITVMTRKEEAKKKGKIGVDFGCSTSLTLSDGRKINCLVEESENLKRLQRKMRRKKKGSANRWKMRLKIRKEYERLGNMRNDKANKVCHMLGEYQVVMQDEQIAQWKSDHGKKVQHGILGRVKQRLMSDETTYVIHKHVPTTKMCTECGMKHDSLTMYDRTFKCPHCNAEAEDRDVHAARNMLWLAENIIGAEHTKFKPADFETEVKLYFGSLKQEADKSSV